MTAVSKSLAVVVLAIASAQVSATEIDDLVNTSQSIRDTFAYGIKTIAGGEYYALKGGIAPAMASNGHISKEQQDAYNAAVAIDQTHPCLLYTSPSPRDRQKSRMPSSA